MSDFKLIKVFGVKILKKLQLHPKWISISPKACNLCYWNQL